MWPESKLNGKEAGSTVWDEGSGFCMEGCTMTQRKRLQKAFSLLFVLCLVFSLAGGMSASAEMTLHTGASKEAVSEETNENSEKETEKANAGQAITPVQTEGKTKTPGETAKEKDGRSTEAQGETAQPETAGCTTEAQGETAQEAGGCTTEAQGETAQPETAGESEPHDQTTEGDSGTDAWNQAPITEASAGRRGPQVQNSAITSLEALLKDGSGPVGDVDQWQVFRLNAEFKLPDLTVHEGDTTVITLPEKLKFNQTTEFDIKDGSSNVVAHAVIDGRAKNITLTYTDYAENHSDVSGSFFFYVQMDRDKVSGEETIPLNFDVSGKTVYGGDIHFKGIGEPQKSTINKSGWQLSDLSSEDHTTLQYQLLVNTAGQAIQNVTITDQIKGNGITFDTSSVVIYKGTWVAEHGDWQLKNEQTVTGNYAISWGSDGSSMTINLGNIAAPDGFVIRYKAQSNYGLSDGEVVENDAALKGGQIQPYQTHFNLTYLEAGGSAEGYKYGITIHKENENGLPLAGAKFRVVRVANNSEVGTITTDATGTGSVSGLLKDTYQIIEVEAPAGYVLSESPVEVKPEDFGTDKIAVKNSINQPVKTQVKVSKVWEDQDNQDGIRPESVTVKLLADGQETGRTAELRADHGWTAEFTDLNQYQDGREIQYRVEEVPVNGYTTEVTGDAEHGIIITNTHETETVEVSGGKTWDDNRNQDGKRPEKITVRLLADGEEKDARIVSEADGWRWNFGSLPKYKDGVEIKYTIKEDAVDGYTAAYDGYNVTNAHTPEKMSLSVRKVWADQDDQAGNRPQSVTIHLLADGKDTGNELVLSGEGGWTGSFDHLNCYQDGNEIVYTIAEDPVDGYTTAIEGDAKAGFTVTNTGTDTPDQPKEQKKNRTPNGSNTSKTGSPGTGDNSMLAGYLWLLLLSAGAIAVLLLRGRKERKR
ncbi:Cna B-type domain-containing protein [Lachnospiraceae bacterium Oil+RF-744-WCA-WT-11]|uniref:Cna B-type domain-containing protein n=2 Tax=Porcincola intestinalis TaxID=2606632 RepID=A0A6L5X133_9FIRM|nr:Cna B-type domain-containing protein [Porcincola intestinalis]